MKYWLKYVIVVVLLMIAFLLIKVIPFWITISLTLFGAVCYFIYLYKLHNSYK
jgi:Ca2+/Na+ antiporter